ncbi:hypothetical protein FHU41_000452 [Psychromicrobium silvestre]|uniref:Gram-positive cocci surface proteins LPxTG domain-containing protein n=1 Tax=Psychromicrobium silvestre TaxID=1645614 RepID=A0A7Y9LRF7_9MICC|nr:hypothetical protein [Psychromicrobium silvestre]NYE94231.1 hypothetical protein [Psychromicrobium silvestre]
MLVRATRKMSFALKLAATLAVALLSLTFTANSASAAPVDTPSILATPTTLTVAELLSSGLNVTGDGFLANENIAVLLDNQPTGQGTFSDQDGHVEYQVSGLTATPGDHTITLEPFDGSPASVAITVTPGPLLQVVLDTPTITSMELATKGIRVTGSNFEKYCSMSFTLNGQQFGFASCDENGGFTSGYFQTIIDAGSYVLAFDDGYGNLAEATLTVTGPTPAAPQVSFSPSTISAADLYFTGTQATGRGFPPNSTVEIVGARSGLPMGTTVSDASGNISYLLKGESIPAQGGITFHVAAFWATADLVVTPSFGAQLSPSTISTTSLASTGTTITGTFFPVGAQVTVTIDGKYPRIVTVDAQRNLSFALKASGVSIGKHVIGLSWLKSSQPAFSAGPAGADHLDLSLTVTAAATAPAKQPAGISPSTAPTLDPAVVPVSSTEELAYSGSNSTPALIGLFLIVVGSAAVFFARRRPVQQR